MTNKCVHSPLGPRQSQAFEMGLLIQKEKDKERESWSQMALEI